jgi:hypothetical protein
MQNLSVLCNLNKSADLNSPLMQTSNSSLMSILCLPNLEIPIAFKLIDSLHDSFVGMVKGKEYSADILEKQLCRISEHGLKKIY